MLSKETNTERIRREEERRKLLNIRLKILKRSKQEDSLEDFDFLNFMFRKNSRTENRLKKIEKIYTSFLSGKLREIMTSRSYVNKTPARIDKSAEISKREENGRHRRQETENSDRTLSINYRDMEEDVERKNDFLENLKFKELRNSKKAMKINSIYKSSLNNRSFIDLSRKPKSIHNIKLALNKPVNMDHSRDSDDTIEIKYRMTLNKEDSNDSSSTQEIKYNDGLCVDTNEDRGKSPREAKQGDIDCKVDLTKASFSKGKASSKAKTFGKNIKPFIISNIVDITAKSNSNSSRSKNVFAYSHRSNKNTSKEMVIMIESDHVDEKGLKLSKLGLDK